MRWMERRGMAVVWVNWGRSIKGNQEKPQYRRITRVSEEVRLASWSWPAIRRLLMLSANHLSMLILCLRPHGIQKERIQEYFWLTHTMSKQRHHSFASFLFSRNINTSPKMISFPQFEWFDGILLHHHHNPDCWVSSLLSFHTSLSPRNPSFSRQSWSILFIRLDRFFCVLKPVIVVVFPFGFPECPSLRSDRKWISFTVLASFDSLIPYSKSISVNCFMIRKDISLCCLSLSLPLPARIGNVLSFHLRDRRERCLGIPNDAREWVGNQAG